MGEKGGRAEPKHGSGYMIRATAIGVGGVKGSCDLGGSDRCKTEGMFCDGRCS